MQYTSKNQRGVAMKKIIVCMCLALFVGMVYAQEVKYYEDYERGYYSIMCVPSSRLKTGEVWYVVVEITENRKAFKYWQFYRANSY